MKKKSSCNNVSYLGSVSLKHLYHSEELCLMNIITNVGERCKEVHYSQFKHKNKQKMVSIKKMEALYTCEQQATGGYHSKEKWCL